MDIDVDDLKPSETDLVGQWLDTGARITGDAIEDRISWLVSVRLERLAASESGSEVLYRDPRDGRLWELTRPWSTAYRGGPQRLRQLPRTEAIDRYPTAQL